MVKQVIEIVRNPTGQLAEGLHALRLDERSLRLLAATDLLLQGFRALRHALLELGIAAREQGLRALALGHVAKQDHEDALVPNAQLGNRSLGGELAAVLAQREDLLSLTHAASRDPGIGKRLHVSDMGGAESLRNEQVEAFSADLVLRVAEDRLGAVVELGDAQGAIEPDDGVGGDGQDRRNLRTRSGAAPARPVPRAGPPRAYRLSRA